MTACERVPYRCRKCGELVMEGEALETDLAKLIYAATERICPACLEREITAGNVGTG